MKKKLLISFSAGESSAFMAQYLWRHRKDDFDMLFIFANTGEENEQTLEFARKCQEYFEFPLVWVEADVKDGRVGTRHKVVNFESASRNGEPFESVIKKYGIPNKAYPHCTRELKLSPIKSYAREYWGKEKYWTAIGIRADEMDRINAKATENRLIYPLCSKEFIPMTKSMVNLWWEYNMPFRLELKGYQGNCKTCWKKSDKKLFVIYKESPDFFEFNSKMESKYPRVGSEFKKDPCAADRTFFRGGRSTIELISQAQQWNGSVEDDSMMFDIDLVGGESCEVFSECE